MITKLVRIQLAVFLVLTLVGVSIAGATYAGLGEAFTNDRFVVRANFADAGGIFEGAEVTYRGVTVGRVDNLTPTASGVQIALKLTRDKRIPAGATAIVANRSAIGEQYIDLQPANTKGPYLQDGSTIPRNRTAVPITTTKLLYDLDRLVNSVPKEDLVTVIDELGTAFDGTGRDLSRIVDSGNALIETANGNVDQTIDLIENSKTVLDTQRKSGSAIKSFAKDLADLSDTLVESDGDIRTVLDEGVETAAQVRGLIDENESDVPVLLGNLVTSGQIVKARLPGVKHILILYPYVVRGGYTVIDKDPKTGHYTSHFGLQLALGPRSCKQGYGTTQKRTPQNTEARKANVGAKCTDEQTTMRGAANAPAPGSGDPGDTPVKTQVPKDKDKPQSGERATQPVVAPYDPATGIVELADGRTAKIGTRGGQQRMFGEDSWKWLLIGPLTP